MSYTAWFKQHALKHKAIVDKLLAKGYDKEQIIDYFVYENMQKEENDFCPLYKKDKKCHDTDYLNCYMCACPNFRFNDEGIKEIEGMTQYSMCSIDSKNGKEGVFNGKIHQDCSKCLVPHKKSYVEKNFNYNWSEIMRGCPL